MAMEHSPFASSVPWQVIHPLGLMLERQPTLVVGEAAFIALALTAFCHAAAHGRQHMLLWLGALLGGTANDVFFMMLPFVDNFWHAQCTFMLTPRLPLYILGVVSIQASNYVPCSRLLITWCPHSHPSLCAGSTFHSSTSQWLHRGVCHSRRWCASLRALSLPVCSTRLST